MKKLLLSTVLVTATAGFALAQDATTPAPAAPSTDAETQAPLTGENMTPTNDPAANDPAPAAPAAPTTDMAEPAAPTAVAPEGFSPLATEALTAETLTGADVYSSEDESVGSVSELVMDDQGQITQVIVDIGGFLGIGAKPVALTMTELSLFKATDGEEIRVIAPMTKAELEALPTHEG